MRKAFLVLFAMAAFVAGVCGCGGSGGNPFLAAVVGPSFATAPQADLTGQTNVFTGSLGTGTTFQFAAIQNVNYNFQISAQPSGDQVIVDIFAKDGTELKDKTITLNGGLGYFHTAASQHVVVVVRPYDPLNTGINITQLQVSGLGSYSQTAFNVNLTVAGDDFTGFGNFNDLAAATDRANLATALMTQVQALHTMNNTGITIGYEGFSLTTAQVKQTQPSLVDSVGHTICATQVETVVNGIGNIDTADLDLWGSFGFAATDPTPSRANGLDVFVVHHFTTDGVVGLSPRPGTALLGNGPGTALCIGAFLQLNGQISGARTVAQMGVVLTHEIGHFLGLQHTTTFSPSPAVSAVTMAIDDGVADTPAAGTLATLKTNATTNGQTSIGIGDGCADENYIMFYQSDANQNQFSPTQITIIKTTLSALQH
jgi:hypothetical protein